MALGIQSIIFDLLSVDPVSPVEGQVWYNTTEKVLKSYQGGAIQAASAKNKFDATTNPTTTDDSVAGYSIGSRWINVTLDREWVCLDATASAAVWKATTSHTAADINLDAIGTPAIRTVQRMQDLFHSAGIGTGGTVAISATPDAVDIAAGSGWVRPTNAPTAALLAFEWSAFTGLVVPDNTTRFIGIEYNGGSPQAVVRTTDTFNRNSEFLVASVVNDSLTLHINAAGYRVGDHAGKMIHRLLATLPIAYDSKKGGLTLGETGVRNVTLSSGRLWAGLEYFDIPALDTSVSGTFDLYYYTGTNWTDGGATQWPNTSYNNLATGLVALGNNKFAALWWYVDLDGKLVAVYGQAEYNSQAEAEGTSPPSSVPPVVSNQCRLIARTVFQKDAATWASKTSYLATVSASGSASSDHGLLSGLGDDDHLQYLPRSGVRAMTGALDMGTFAITNVGNVDGVDVSAHASRHNPGGADAVSTAAPSIGIGGGNSEGVAVSLARSDHGHAIRTTTGPTDLTVGAIGDGHYLTRSGSSIVGTASSPSTDTDAIHKSVSGEINSLTLKGTPIGADLLLIEDSAGTFSKKKVAISSLPTGSGDGDAIHKSVSGEINSLTEKTVPVDADLVIIEDSATSFSKKKLQLGNVQHKVKQTIEVELAADFSTNSTTFVTLLTTNITIKANSRILAWAATGGNMNGASTTRLLIDGVAHKGAGSHGHGGSGGPLFLGTSAASGVLTAGTKTVTLQIKTSGNTINVRAATVPDDEGSTLVVQEIV